MQPNGNVRSVTTFAPVTFVISNNDECNGAILVTVVLF